MAGNLLWAHLLRKDATKTDTPSQIPPIAPQDKAGTSMRMLIHDTQVNLEKFSSRLDGLLHRVDDCRAQVVNANKLLDVERDKVLTEVLEIANRCQSEMKAHVGTPAQASALDLVGVSQGSTEKSVQALEKRIDALQALLQTQAHVMQSIQDQQNILIGAILPLVPVLHGVPPQLDQIKAGLSDMVENAVSTMTNSVESVQSTLVAEFANGHGRAWPCTRVGSWNKSMSNSRRKRSNASVFVPQEFNVSLSSPLDSRGPHHSLKRARIEGTTHHPGNVQMPRKASRLAVPLTNSGDPPPVLHTPRTPRQPLADLLFPPGSNTSRARHRITSRMNSMSREYMRPLEMAGGPSTIPSPIARPLSRPLEPLRPDSTITRRQSASFHDPSIDRSATVLNATGPSDQNGFSKEVKMEEILASNLTGFFSIHSTPLSTPPSSLADAPLAELVQDPPSLSDPNADPSPPKSMSLRDRRAQMSRIGRTETRPFIPMVPWSDEEE